MVTGLCGGTVGLFYIAFVDLLHGWTIFTGSMGLAVTDINPSLFYLILPIMVTHFTL